MFTRKKDLLDSIKDKRLRRLAADMIAGNPIDNDYSLIEMNKMSEYIEENYKERALREGCGC